MADKRITRKKLKTHWHYSWWKYVMLTALSIMVVDIVFAMTAYRAPEEKKIELYFCNGYMNTAAIEEEFWPMLIEACPDQEELVVMNIDLTSQDGYSDMQFTVYSAAHQGDICLLPASEVKKLAADGADEIFIELTPYVESGAIDVEGIDLSGGMYKAADGTEGLYGIPADSLYGLVSYGNDPADSLFCIMSYSGNDDNAAAALGILVGHFRAEKPEGYDEYREKKEAESSSATSIFY